MNSWTRRSFIVAGSATAACSNSIISGSRDSIDRRVDNARAELFNSVSGARQLAEKAAGLLIIPDVTQAGFMVGGAYGEGALMIGDAKVAYFSLATASFGIQAGVQRYHHALFFMTQETLAGFRYSDGWELGVDAQYTTSQDSASFGITTNTINLPVYALIYGQQGLIAGATFEGAKYSSLIR